MKQNEEKSKWLEEIRDTMADFEAELPADGWERVSSAMGVRPVEPQPGKAKVRIVPMWGRVAAVAVVLLLVGLGGKALWPTSEPLPDLAEVAKESSADPAEVATETLAIQSPTTGVSTDQPTATRTTPVQLAAKAFETEVHLEQTVDPSQQAFQPEPTPAADTIPDRPEPRPESLPRLDDREEEAVLLAMGEASEGEHRSRWSLGLNISGGRADTYEDSQNEVMHYIPVDSTLLATRAWSPTRGAESDERIYEATNNRSYSIGLVASKELNSRIAVETGLVYTLLTSDVETRKGPCSQYLHYLGVPLRLKLQIVGGPRWQLYTAAGTMAEHAIRATRGGRSFTIDNWQWSVNGGIGVQYNLSRQLGLYVEPGVNYYFDDGSGVISQRTERPLSLNLLMGVRFNY